MTSKEWHLRVSWSLDELTEEMVRHFGYADRTAMVKSILRGCALYGKGSMHDMLVRMSKEPPAAQDRMDAELLRRWHAGETIGEGPMEIAARRVAKRTSVDPTRVLTAAAEELMRR